MNENIEDKVWIIQRCIDAWTNHYEDWAGYCENPMMYPEMIAALEECGCKWPTYEFRGHNINYVAERHLKGDYPRPFNKHSV